MLSASKCNKPCSAMRKSLAVLSLPALLLLAACDDGSERIAELEGNLEAERARIVELEKASGEVETVRGELEALTTERDGLTGERDTIVAERDTVVAERDELRTRLEAAEARVKEIEAGVADRLDAGAISAPLAVVFTKLREADQGLREIRLSFEENDERLGTTGAMRRALRDAGREIEKIATTAKIDLEKAMADNN